MEFFQRLPLKIKLIISSLIPLIVLFYYLQLDVKQELRNKQSAEEVLADASNIETLSHILHELQKERALTRNYLSDRFSNDIEPLLAQRERTDRELNKLYQYKNQRFKKRFNPVLDSLSLIRSSVNARKNSRAGEFYLHAKNRILDEVVFIIRESRNQEIGNNLEEHLYLLYTKDFLAGMRAELSDAIAAKKFNGTDFGDFAAVKGQHDVKLKRFLNIASPELKEFFYRKFDNPVAAETYAIIDTIYKMPSAVGKYDFVSWWNIATSTINILNEVEDYSISFIKDKAQAAYAAANRNLTYNVIITSVTLVLLIIIIVATIKGIVAPVNQIKNAADMIAGGETSVKLDIHRNDEMGSLAKSFNRMIDITKQFSLSAVKIGEGDYDTAVNIRGEHDMLGKALNDMKNNLKRLSEQNSRRTWLLTGNSDLNTRLRGEKTISELAEQAAAYLTEMLGGQIGALYIRSNGSFKIAGSYGFDRSGSFKEKIIPGEGTAGQAAVDKKSVILKDVPDDYLKIKSATGECKPANILIHPFIYEGEVIGILEVGSLHEFSELQLELLNLISENTAIAFNGAIARKKMSELLEETQRQAEELEVQQEELKMANEELLEKTKLLTESENELRAQQEELQQTNEELMENAAKLEEQKFVLENAKMEIENKARQLETTSKYKSEFLANMSHELRTPLNSILILSQLLNDNRSGGLSSKEVLMAKNIYTSGNDLLNLINEILDLSKVEAGRLELDIADIKLPDVAEDMEMMFSELAASRGIGFEIVRDEKLQVIKSDMTRLEQILKNLLSNSFKFTSKGGMVTLSMGKAKSRREYDNKHLYGTDVVEFRVTDNGIGIPKDKLNVIFEAFQQADGSTKRKYGGTGLGLSISRELAGALGGEIHVESVEGGGSTFSLFIPAEFRSERDEEVILSSGNVSAGNDTGEQLTDDRENLQANDRKVLIVEDDQVFSGILLETVRAKGFKGIIASQGNIGLSYARLYKPDAIILDMKIPVIDGTELLKLFKNDPELRHIPVQIVSGFEYMKEGLDLGAFDFLKKPVNSSQLNKAFDKIVDFVNKKMKKLLIVEDNELHNSAIKELIGNGDVKCFSAYSGSQAYDMLSSDKYDCMIVDLGLPDMSGFELLDKIRSNEALKHIPIVVYTGRELTKEESVRLNSLANTVVLKTADSHERLLDETILFLHRVEAKLPKDKQQIIRKLHKSDEVLKNKKVLIVDDDSRNVYSLKHALANEGMNCISAVNGEDALKKLLENPDTDIVLMDIMMPVMDGFEAAREIRKAEKYSKLPIIALTAKAMKGDREKCLAFGMSDYISKPVNMEQLLGLMKVWMYSNDLKVKS